MPTGHTDRLEAMDWDLKQWLIENIPRAFGVLVCLKDASFDLTHEEILQRLRKEGAGDYYQTKVTATVDELTEKKQWTDNQWEEDLQQAIAQITEANDCRRKEAEIKGIHYRPALAKLKAMHEKTTNGDYRGMLQYAIDQIDSISTEFTPDEVYYQKVPAYPWEEHKRLTLQELEKDVQRYGKSIKEDTERYERNLKFYMDWIAHITELLEQEE